MDLGRLLRSFRYFSATFDFGKPLKSGPAWIALLFLAKREGRTIFLTRAAVCCNRVGGILGGSFLLMRLLTGWFLFRPAKRAAVRSLVCATYTDAGGILDSLCMMGRLVVFYTGTRILRYNLAAIKKKF